MASCPSNHQLYWAYLSRPHLWWFASHLLSLYGCVTATVSGSREGRLIVMKILVKLLERKSFRAVFAVSIAIFIASVIDLGAKVSTKPLGVLGYKRWDADKKSFYSPYATSIYLGWALSSAIALLVTGLIHTYYCLVCHIPTLTFISYICSYILLWSLLLGSSKFTGGWCSPEG